MINNDIIKQNNLACENILLTKEEFTNARSGVFNIKLTPTKYVPNDWFEKNLKNLPKTLDKICEFMVIYKGCHELRQRKHIDKRIVKAKQQKRILHN